VIKYLYICTPKNKSGRSLRHLLVLVRDSDVLKDK
jgi:hypothetical protein